MNYNPDDRFVVIHWRGGQIWLWARNVRRVKCRRCEGEVSAGEGWTFKKGYQAPVGSGYLCKACIGQILEETKEWHWNAFTEELFPAEWFTQKPVSGAALREGWTRLGQLTLGDR